MVNQKIFGQKQAARIALTRKGFDQFII